MTITGRAFSNLSHLRSAASAAVGVITALLLAVAVAGCAVGVPESSSAAPDAKVSNPAASAGQRIVMTFDGKVVPATLTNTTAAHQFAALLPLTLDLRDPMGQAKSGELPTSIDHTGLETVTDPTDGGIYYAPDSGGIAIFYDDLGQSVPPPGLVRLGTVDSGMDAIAAAGNRVRLRIYPAERPFS